MSQDKEPRRHFLRRVLAIVPATALGGTTAITLSKDASADSSSPNKARSYQPTYFTADEWAFVNAAVDHLIPSDQYGAGAIETGVPEFIDRQMNTPYGAGQLWYMQGPFHPDVAPELGYQLNLNPRDIYRQGIAACNAWCQKNHGKVFAELDKDLQRSTLKAMESNEAKFDAIPAKTFFSYLLGNTKEGYFADPMYGGNQKMGGWKMIGFPGARADYADWVDQYNVKYPYGPVSILGEKG